MKQPGADEQHNSDEVAAVERVRIVLPAMTATSPLDHAVLAQTARDLKKTATEHGYDCEVVPRVPDQGHVEWQTCTPGIVRQVAGALERMVDGHLCDE